MNDCVYWIWFSQIFGICSVRGDQILSNIHTPKELYEKSEDELLSLKIFTRGEINRLSQTTIDKAINLYDRTTAIGGFMLTPNMPQYPRRLWNICAAPTVLYCLGDMPNVDKELSIGMVGARNPSKYGEVAAAYISKGLAMAGAVVVSGLANGIDSICHSTAIENGGKTIAILGCGIDTIYPSENKELWHRILNGNGAIISEYPLETLAKGFHFPVRNRLISALSSGVCIIEAEDKSGSLITAGHALTQNRDVFAVPGSIFSKLSVGTNRLIKQGAKPVTHPNDILEDYILTSRYNILDKEYFAQITNDIEPNIEKTVKEEKTKTNEKNLIFIKIPPAYLSSNQLIIFNELKKSEQTPDELSENTQLPIQIILSALTELEIFNVIKPVGGRKFSLC